jgi:hypothetical protein
MERTVEHKIPLTISVACDSCGSGDIAIPEMPGSFDAITCCDCGAELGSRADLDNQVDSQIKAQVAEEFARMLREHKKPRPMLRVV